MWLDFKLWIAWLSSIIKSFPNTALCTRYWPHIFPYFLVANCFHYSPLLCYEFSYIWAMSTCQHTAQTLPALHTTAQHWSVWTHCHNKQHVSATGQSLHYIKLQMDLSLYGLSWKKSHYSTWQKNCMCIYQHVRSVFPQTTLKCIFF